MNTFKLTMPNGIIIESTWTNEVASTAVVKEPKAPKLELPKAAAPVKAAKQPTKAVKAPKVTKAVKAAKQPTNNEALLASIRQLKAAGKYSEAVALTPPAWTQVIGEIQRAAERQGTTYNAAVSSKKSAKKVASKKRKAAKAPKVPAVAEGPKGALDMKADTGSAKPTQLDDRAAKQQQLKASLRDELTTIGVDDFVIEILTGDRDIKALRALYTTASEDEVLDLMDACKQEAVLIEDAAERIEDAGIDASVVNQLVELWKAFGAKLRSIAESMTAAA
jgi:hypothetical protein